MRFINIHDTQIYISYEKNSAPDRKKLQVDIDRVQEYTNAQGLKLNMKNQIGSSSEECGALYRWRGRRLRIALSLLFTISFQYPDS